MIDWKSYIEVVSVGPDEPDDYDLCIQNNHDTCTIEVKVKIVYTLSEEIKSITINPSEQIIVCTVDFGPTIDNCDHIELISAKKAV